MKNRLPLIGNFCEMPPDDDEVFEAIHQDVMSTNEYSPWLDANIVTALDDSPEKLALIAAYLRDGDYNRAGALLNDTTCIYWGEQARLAAERKYQNLMRAAREAAEVEMVEMMLDARRGCYECA